MDKNPVEVSLFLFVWC